MFQIFKPLCVDNKTNIIYFLKILVGWVKYLVIGFDLPTYRKV